MTTRNQPDESPRATEVPADILDGQQKTGGTMELEGGNFTKGEAQINRNERDIVDHGLALDPATSPKRFDGALKGRLA